MKFFHLTLFCPLQSLYLYNDTFLDITKILESGNENVDGQTDGCRTHQSNRRVTRNPPKNSTQIQCIIFEFCA